MTVFLLYLITRLDAIQGLILGYIVFVGFFSAILIMTAIIERTEESKLWIKKALISVLIAGLLGVVIPSTKSALMLVGFTTIQNIQGVEQLPEKTVKAIDKLLSDYIDESEEGK